MIPSTLDYEDDLRKPSKKVMRDHKNKMGKKLLEADQIRSLIDAAPLQLKAMILLGINCGFGNHDCGALPHSAIGLDSAWIDFPRPKTAVDRSCSLWQETVEALRQVLEERTEPRRKDDQGLVFIKSNGRPWVVNERANSISIATASLMKKVGCHRPGILFYVLRHTFATVASGVRDQIAVNHCMGHSDGHISATYREEIDPTRIRAVADFVHDWLFGTDDDGSREPQEVRSNAPLLVTASPAVTVEYDQDGMRAQKHFDNANSAKKFYTAMDIESRNPKVVIEEDEQPQLRVFG
jgi:integrase